MASNDDKIIPVKVSLNKMNDEDDKLKIIRETDK